MGTIIDVKKIVEEKKILLKNNVGKLKNKNIFPKLAVILANDEDASKVYVGKKRELCKEIGVIEDEYIFDASITTEDMLNIIEKLNNDDSVDGILVQLPVFKHLDENLILNTISPKKDVDGFHPLNLGKLLIGKPDVISCTPKGIMSIIDSLNINLEGLNATVVGRSVIVGKPIFHLLLARGTTTTICHSKTKNLQNYTKNADILIVATGVPHIITVDMVKKDAIVIDVGINRVDGKLKGDVDTQNVKNVAKYITPVPGGVGLTTVVSLLENLVDIASKRV